MGRLADTDWKAVVCSQSDAVALIYTEGNLCCAYEHEFLNDMYSRVKAGKEPMAACARHFHHLRLQSLVANNDEHVASPSWLKSLRT
jgi:hypothetical protein